MPASLRLAGWILAANAAGLAATMLLGGRTAEAAQRFLLWCGIG